MSKIQIFSVVGKNGNMFADFLRKNMIGLSSKKHELEFNCFMNSRRTAPKGWKYLEHILRKKHTSLNHTMGMNRVVDYVNSDFVICTDTDIALLIPNWDQYLIDTINERNLDVLGVGFWNNPRGYSGFPIITFFIARSKSYSLANPDFRPELIDYPNQYGIGAKELIIKTDSDSDIYGRRKGSVILLDSGWQLPRSFKSFGMKGEVFAKAKEYSIKYVSQIWKFGEDLGICHKGKGTRRRKGVAFQFFSTIENYLNQKYQIEI